MLLLLEEEDGYKRPAADKSAPGLAVTLSINL
jgi:hypothetical protein